jgi:hypothetical protein
MSYMNVMSTEAINDLKLETETDCDQMAMGFLLSILQYPHGYFW